eukprot:gene8121-1368_t
MLLKLLLLLAAPLISLAQPPGPPCLPVTQRFFLVQLWNSTDGPLWLNSSGWEDWENTSIWGSDCTTSYGRPLPDYCCWYGVTCCESEGCAPGQDDITCNCPVGFVVQLDLRGNELLGFIPMGPLLYLSCAGVLRNLLWQENFIYGNFLSGPIPASLSALRSLEVIDLSRNRMLGPVTMLTAQASTAHSGRFSGWPLQTGAENLRKLRLEANLVFGTIPDSIADSPLLLEIHGGDAK